MVIDVGVSGLKNFLEIMNISEGKAHLNTSNQASNYRIRCNIAVTSWLPAVNEWVKGDVILEAKDGRARVTVAGLELGGPGKETCIKSLETTVDARMSTLKSLAGNW